jgi:GT2 family glycosyltransferase
LLRLLAALTAQREVPRFELIVVDDGSTDDTATRIAEIEPHVPFRIRFIRQAQPTGPAGARNRGWRSTDAPIVAFTDDDCMPEPEWLNRLIGGFRHMRVDIVAGVTTYPPDQADRRDAFAYWMEDDGVRGHYPTCNVAYRRSAIEAVDGFDEDSFRHRRPHRADRGTLGDDTDLAWRAIEAGFRAGSVPDAVVHHEVFPSSWRRHMRNVPRLEGIVLLLKKHPRLRAHFGRRVVYRGEDALALGVLLGVGAMAFRRTRPLGVVATVASGSFYARMFYRHRILPQVRGGYPVAVPLSLVADAYAAIVMLRASLRYRTLVL